MANDTGGIDPKVLRLILALVVVGALVEIVSHVNEQAAWALVIILIVGALVNNPVVIGFITLGANSLAEGVN